MRLALSETACTFEGRDLPIGQVVLAAVHRGEWAELDRDVARSMGWLVHDAAPVDSQNARHMLIAWRRERHLLSAQDYHAWLAARSLTVDDMAGHLRRRAATEPVAARSNGPSAESAGEDLGGDELASIVYQETIFRGRMLAWARHLTEQEAARKALGARGMDIPASSPEDITNLMEAGIRAKSSRLHEVAPDLLRQWCAEVLALERAWTIMNDQLADPQLITRCLEAHRLDWQRLEWEEATFAREDVAREAGLWAREGTLTLTAVAERAGVVTRVDRAYAGDAGELAGMLLGAQPGELIGPIASGSEWRLVQVRERTPPSAADTELRRRAMAELLEDVLARYLAGRVEWHAPI